MGLMDSTKSSRWVTSVGFTVLSLVPSLAFTAEVTASIRVGASHSDNIYLDTSSNEIDDIIYRASPSLGITHTSPSLDANLRYQLDWYQYDDEDATETYHMGEGSLTGKLFNEALQVEIGASRYQTLRDQDDIQSDYLPLTNNLVDRDEFYANPRVVTKLSKAVTLSTDYRYTEGDYDDPDIQDDTSHHASFSLENYAAGSGLTWALRYDGRKTEYDISREWEYQQASAELGFWVNGSTRVFASGGEESPWDEPFNSSLEDTFWEAGLAYEGGNRLSAEVAAGERSFGTSWRGNLEYTFARGRTAASYSQTPTTTAFDQSNGQRGVPDPDDPDDLGDLDEFLDVPGQDERYLSKRLDWSLYLDFRRTSFSLVLFDEDREDRIQADGTLLDNQAQRGVSADFSWQAGVRTAFVVFGSIIHRESGADNEQDYNRVGIGVNYDLGRRTQVSLDYAYDEQEPTGSNSTSRDYKSNVISLFFTLTM